MKEKFNILFFDDNIEQANKLVEFLQKEPQSPNDPELVVKHYDQGKDVFNAIGNSSTPPDLALLDVHQEGHSFIGLEICEEFKKKWPSSPAIFVSEVYVEEEHRVRGYKSLGNLYLTKKDSKEFLRDVIIEQIRIARLPLSDKVYQKGSLKVDIYKYREVHWRGKKIELKGNDLRVLVELTKPSNSGKVFSARALGARVWSPKLDNSEKLRQSIVKIRKEFEKSDEDFKKQTYGILTDGGNGYFWRPDKR